MTVVQWARSIKPALVSLQLQHGIPAAWAAAQMAHESAVDGGRGLSSLATDHHNYAGLKWAEWQSGFGCRQVRMGTWEEIGGVATAVEDAFCSCPSWEAWLRVYSELLTGPLYRPALAFAYDPLLYGFHVWQAGWATDSRYITGVARWMTWLANDYREAQPRPPWRKVPIHEQENGRLLCTGYLAVNETLAPVRPLWTESGGRVEWINEGPRVILAGPSKL